VLAHLYDVGFDKMGCIREWMNERGNLAGRNGLIAVTQLPVYIPAVLRCAEEGEEMGS